MSGDGVAIDEMTADDLWALFDADEALAAAEGLFGTSALGTTIPCAAIAVTIAAWRNTRLEQDHAAGRLSDAEMLVANAATNRVARSWLDEGAEIGLDPESLVAEVCDSLRHLGGGLLVRDVISDSGDLERAAWEMAATCFAAANAIGFDGAIAALAIGGATCAGHWWGTPWWSLMVEEALALVPLPGEPAPGPPPLSSERCRRLLVDWPDACPPDVATWAVDEAGIGFRVERARRAWRDSHGLDPAWRPPAAVTLGPVPPMWILATHRELSAEGGPPS